MTFELRAIGLLVAALAGAPALANGPGEAGWHGWGWGGMLFGTLMMLVFWGGLIVLIVLAVRWLSTGTGQAAPPAPSRRALEILEERFARGEIDKDEFAERKRLLSG